MEEMKKMPYVWLLTNPLKQVICRNTYTYNMNSKSEESKFFVPVVKDYMDLSKGIWNVSLDTYVIKTNHNAADIVLDISTNLVSGFLFDKKKNTNESRNVCLGKIFLVSPPYMVTGGPFEKKWFNVQTNREFSNFEIYVQQNALSHPLTSLELEFEITFLFQQIK